MYEVQRHWRRTAAQGREHFAAVGKTMAGDDKDFAGDSGSRVVVARVLLQAGVGARFIQNRTLSGNVSLIRGMRKRLFVEGRVRNDIISRLSFQNPLSKRA